MARLIERLEEILVYSDPDNEWLRLYFDRVKFPGGREGRYNRIVEGTGNPGVAILPTIDNHVGFVRQFRYAVGEEVWEIPRGYSKSANVAEEARRELKEETGYSAKKLTALAIIHPNSAVLETHIELFAAECDTEGAVPSKVDSEISEFKWFKLEDALKAVVSGKIKDAISLSALLHAIQRKIV